MVTYDDIAYASKVHRGRHIERLHTHAYLRGLRVAHPAQAKVLELGCGTGEALLPMACEFPSAQFVGIDSSAGEIAAAAELQKQCGAGNVTFLHADLLSYETDEKFDYIICHGLYSWCPEAVRTRIWSILEKNLAERGIALMSYNTHPGASFRLSVGKLLRFYDRPELSVSERAAHLRAVLQRLLGSIDYDFEHPYNIMLHRELSRIMSEGDHYLFHEVLADDIHPELVSSFIDIAESHGLQFLGDARFGRVSLNRMLSGNNPAQGFQNILQVSSSQRDLEQTMDFLFGAAFRETILCRSEQTLLTEIPIDSLKALSYSGYYSHEDEHQGFTDAQEGFIAQTGKKLSVIKPLLKGALLALQAVYPNYLGFADLLSKAQHIVKEHNFLVHEFDENILAGALLEWMQRDAVDFALYPAACADRVHAHPSAATLARAQAVAGKPLTNLFYETVALDGLAQALVAHLDGRQDVDGLLGVAEKCISDGAGGIKEDGEIVTDPQRIRTLLPALIESTLETIRRAGLLQAR